MPPWSPQVPVAVNLRRLFPTASFVGCGDVRTLFATDRSADCRPHSVFAVIRGTSADGQRFIPEALERGATALLVEQPLAHVNIPQCVVPDVRRAYAELCAALAANPARRLGLAGVTGTNGKTTTTWLIRSIMQAAGKQTGLLGTIEYSDGHHTEPARLTTPDSRTLAQWLGSMVDHGTAYAAMELSSHALEQRRTAGTLLDAAVIGNITQDHFDYHGSYDAYRRSKLRIFDYLKPAGLAVLNLDDAGSRSCLDEAPKRVVTYGFDSAADVSAVVLEESLAGSRFRLTLGVENVIVETQLVGRHNISNCLAAAAVTAHFGVSAHDIALGIETLECVPGRMQPIDCGQPFSVFVDYAHTEDALRRCLQSLKSLTRGRVICVFGAGGDRDRSKRPLMGRAAATADAVVITSDNPRSEDPARISRDILAGCAAAQPHVELDREVAIAWALRAAKPGDAVLVAGKGHETEQIIGSDRRHFDDAEVVRRVLTRTAIVPEPHHRTTACGLHCD